MSVYTLVSAEALAAWLHPLPVGSLQGHAGIAAGMQNSNYYVDTADGAWVLTLFEGLKPAELDVYLPLLAHLARRGLPCAAPCADPSGLLWRPLAGKPAALVSRLPGRALEQPEAAQCYRLGEMLARLHAAAADFSGLPDNPCGLPWCQRMGVQLLPGLSQAEATLLRDELAWQGTRHDARQTTLPRGMIHADLFRDNVLWQEGEISGVLDFYFAGTDCLALDLAIAANDWCSDAEAEAALLAGYASQRPLSAAESAAWPGLQRLAALRFWLLRLDARANRRAGSLVTLKDPEEFRVRLQQLRLAEGGPAR